MNSIKFVTMLVSGAIILSLTGCTDSAPSGPKPGLGNATVTKYVAVGNSLTAGYQSNGLYESAQIYSYPNLIAQQLTAAGASIGTFQQPIYPDPGNPDATGKAARYELISLADPNNPVIGPKGLTTTAPTSVPSLALARPFDNLGIPGIPLLGFMDTTGTYNGNNASGLGGLVLRTTAFPKSVLRHVQLLKTMGQTPDLVTFWLGANDVLGYATTGGASPSIPAPTSSGIFTALYTQALDTLVKTLPSAKVVVANIPDVSVIPFFTTIGPKLKTNLATVLGAGGFFYFQKNGESGVGSGKTQFSDAYAPLITLKGSTYATKVGSPTFQAYRDLGMTYAQAQALGMDSTKPFGLHPQNPWPNAYTLDSLEQVATKNAVVAFNSTISSVAAAKGAKVVDIYTIFNQINTQGYKVSGELYTSAYITGGLFSLDGVHPSSRGYGIVANEFIKVMNSGFGMSVPQVDISRLPGIPAPLSKISRSDKGYPTIAPEAFKSFDMLFGEVD